MNTSLSRAAFVVFLFLKLTVACYIDIRHVAVTHPILYLEVTPKRVSYLDDNYNWIITKLRVHANCRGKLLGGYAEIHRTVPVDGGSAIEIIPVPKSKFLDTQLFELRIGDEIHMSTVHYDPQQPAPYYNLIVRIRGEPAADAQV